MNLPEFSHSSAPMSFAETYSHELLETRRIRSQRARFWSKIVSLALMLTLGAVFYSEPQLRFALMQAGTKGVMQLTGRSAAGASDAPALPGGGDLSGLQNLLQAAQQQSAAPNTSPRPTVVINRGGDSTPGQPRFQRVGNGEEQAPVQGLNDPSAMAEQVSRLLEQFKIGQ